ncbi:hypothetical protein YC2023_123007 [Brassica napus]
MALMIEIHEICVCLCVVYVVGMLLKDSWRGGDSDYLSLLEAMTTSREPEADVNMLSTGLQLMGHHGTWMEPYKILDQSAGTTN